MEYVDGMIKRLKNVQKKFLVKTKNRDIPN